MCDHTIPSEQHEAQINTLYRHAQFFQENQPKLLMTHDALWAWTNQSAAGMTSQAGRFLRDLIQLMSKITSLVNMIFTHITWWYFDVLFYNVNCTKSHHNLLLNMFSTKKQNCFKTARFLIVFFKNIKRASCTYLHPFCSSSKCFLI